MSAPTLLFVCPNCLVAADDTACDLCGRPLTKFDLSPPIATPEGAKTCVTDSSPGDSTGPNSTAPSTPMNKTGARGKPIAGEATGARWRTA